MTGVTAITGATGFVGSHALARLVRERRPARALSRRPGAISAEFAPRVEVVLGDLGDGPALERLTSGAETVLHLAGSLWERDRAGLEAVNVAGTARLAAAAFRNGVKRFVHVSSLAAREPAISLYGASKRAGEEALQRAAGDMSWTILRPPGVYGPGDRATLPLFAQLARRWCLVPGTPQGRFSLLYVEDLAELLVALTSAPFPASRILEADDCAPDGYGWPDLARLAPRTQTPPRLVFLPRPLMSGLARLASHLPLSGDAARLTPSKVAELYHRDWVCRGDKAEVHTDWRARVRFAEGAALTLGWYARAGWLPDRAGAARTRGRGDIEEGAR